MIHCIVSCTPFQKCLEFKSCRAEKGIQGEVVLRCHLSPLATVTAHTMDETTWPQLLKELSNDYSVFVMLLNVISC